MVHFSGMGADRGNRAQQNVSPPGQGRGQEQGQGQQSQGQPRRSPNVPTIPTFHIVDLYLIPNRGGNVKAIASVKFGPVISHKWRLIWQPGEEPWIAPPTETFVNKQTGVISYRTLLEIPREWREELNRVVWAAYETKVRELGGEV